MGLKLYKLQACVETLQEAILAEQKGADEIELCNRLDLDGLTPDSDLVRQVLQAINIPVHVMIRPRDGGFDYTEEEVLQMELSITTFNALPIAGMVIGASKNNQIDIRLLQRLTSKIERRLIVTIHKVIDTVTDPIACIERMKADQLKVDRILTSGAASTAEQGISKLLEMKAATEGYCKIIAAGKITSDNIDQLHQHICLNLYHGRQIV